MSIKIDHIRRECEDIGSNFAKLKREGANNAEAMKALGEIHSEATKPGSHEADADQIADLAKRLDAFRTKYKIDSKVAGSYRGLK